MNATTLTPATRAAITPIDRAVAGLDSWLDTMRGPGGYGGPVAHWWQQSLVYTGPGLDWRYEGIIEGYVKLWQRSGEAGWLLKARRAGDDLVQGQSGTGHYPASGFEANPSSAGTPHEAAADAGLLTLALALREAQQPGWETYAATAERNLRLFYLDQLWDNEAQSFRDSPGVPSFVPNKAATACEALFLLAELRSDDSLVERYVLPTLHRVVEHQERGNGKTAGAIAQNSFGRRKIEKYFPIYIARCVPALLRGYRWSGQEHLLAAARRAVGFLVRWTAEDGSLPAVIYPAGRSNSYPRWIAPLGDILRATEELANYGEAPDFAATEARLLAGQTSSGGIRTASGFAAQAGGLPPKLPDLRDLLPVAGWCDKAFRYLAGRTGKAQPQWSASTFSSPCTFRGRTLLFSETPEAIEVTDRGAVAYRWHKGAAWADVAKPEFWLK